jgi:hypothetical protein
MLEKIKQWIERDGLDGPSQRIDLVYKRSYLFSILRENMTLQQIGNLFNRHHSVVIHGLKQHEKMMSETYEYNGMEIKGNLAYLSVINEYKKEYDNLLSNGDKHQQAVLCVTRYGSSEDQGGKIAADSGAGESPYSKGCAQ